jgi:lipopolysaccharide/colanic/teichoic acid biosynthesis glycosyltransferase
MRPGVTGYWRATRRSRFELGDVLATDARYVRNWSLLEDFKVYVTTLGATLAGRRRVVEITDSSRQRNT